MKHLLIFLIWGKKPPLKVVMQSIRDESGFPSVHADY